MIFAALGVLFLFAPLLDHLFYEDENRRDVNKLAKAARNRKEQRRKYTWQNPGTGNSAGKCQF